MYLQRKTFKTARVVCQGLLIFFMEQTTDNTNDQIKKVLLEKAALKQDVFQKTSQHFAALKNILKELTDHYIKEVSQKDQRIRIAFHDKGEFEALTYIGSDALVFVQHTNVFQFDSDNPLWKTQYLKEDNDRGYCGIINVYNFLADSFKYNRLNDVGYLIARIFINKDEHFMVQGKRQMGFLYNDFINAQLDKEKLTAVTQSIILYTIDFDLFTPPYESVKEVSLGEMQAMSDMLQVKTGKRLGFRFHADSDDIV